MHAESNRNLDTYIFKFTYINMLSIHFGKKQSLQSGSPIRNVGMQSGMLVSKGLHLVSDYNNIFGELA